MENKETLIRKIFLGVYVAISVATFYHSAWGFGLLAGDPPTDWIQAGLWWFIGGAQAAAIDIGMGAIVYAMLHGWERGWLVKALFLLATFSAYSQLVYSTAHAVAHPIGQVPPWLNWLGYVFDARTVLFPLALPGFALIYAFAAKGEIATQPATDLQAEPVQLQEVAMQTDQPQPAQVAMQADEPQTEKLDTATRRQRVATAKRKNPDVPITELANLFAVNPSTISRDITHLQDAGLLNGTH